MRSVTVELKPAQTTIDRGVLYAGGAFVIWGIIPIYWKEALGGIDAVEIVMHRIVWTLVFAIAALASWERLPKLYEALTTRRSLLLLSASAILIAINWGIFIWAVTVDRIIETSLGYYINPLVNFVLGAVFLSERLTRIQLIAVALATLGVLNQTIALGYLPWISLVLAVSFGVYGLIRKTVAVESLEGLTVESIILAPFALGYIVYLTVTQQGAFTHAGLVTDINLVIAGPLTAIPLLLFAAGARLVRLSTVGFLQYLAPSIALLIAVFMYHEPFTTAHAITFAFIWAALALITWEALRRDSYSAA